MDKQDYTLENMRRLVLMDKDRIKFTRIVVRLFLNPYTFEYQVKNYVISGYKLLKTIDKLKQYFNIISEL